MRISLPAAIAKFENTKQMMGMEQSKPNHQNILLLFISCPPFLFNPIRYSSPQRG
jgi:hypothetical protein